VRPHGDGAVDDLDDYIAGRRQLIRFYRYVGLLGDGRLTQVIAKA